MKRFLFVPLVLVSAALIISCEKNNDNPEGYADESMWCCKPSKASEAVDVFYVVSTNIMRSFREDGKESFTAVLNEEEKSILAAEIKYIQSDMFPEKVNFYSPYYHQMTMNCLASEEMTLEYLYELFMKTKQEVFDAFDYYMKHFNNGRPFIIAGYSQGAVLTEKLLFHLTEEQSKRLVAAYMMGFGLDAEAVANPNIKAATGPTDTGVTVSFNSVANREAIYETLLNNAVDCINPINWCTDSTPADFVYDGETLTVHVDTEKNILIVDGFHYDKHDTQAWDINPWSADNYHNLEIYFYAASIRQNALDRIGSMQQ